MKLIYSESQNNYSNYLFSYQVFALKEENDTIDEMYQKGFLPVRSIKDLFYLSRSCRVNLSEFELSSENRRVLKKINDITVNKIPIGDFRMKPELNLQKDYLNETAVKRIFSANGNYTDIFEFGKTGVVVTLLSDNIIHYAHQFYNEKNLGMALMTYVVNYAKENNLSYVYLGTCYGNNSLYKAQFAGFEYYDGITWTNDLNKLRYLVEKDNKPVNKHMLQDEIYLEKFYKVNKIGRLIKILRNE